MKTDVLSKIITFACKTWVEATISSRFEAIAAQLAHGPVRFPTAVAPRHDRHEQVWLDA